MMFLPYETSFSMWFSAMPRYEWVPVAQPELGACAPEGEGLQGSTGGSTTLHMQAVFKGVEWTPYPVWRAQANPAWDLCARNCRDEADERSQERARHAKREQPPIGSAPSWDAPQSPDASRVAKLDDKGT